MFGILEDLQINQAIDVVHYVISTIKNGKDFHSSGMKCEMPNNTKVVADKIISAIYKDEKELGEAESEHYINELYKVIEKKINSHANFERGKMLLDEIKAEDIIQKKINSLNRKYFTPIINLN